MDEQQLRKGLFQQILGAGKGIANILAPTLTKAAGGVAGVAGMGKDYIDYKLAKDPKEKAKQIEEYNKSRKQANDALKIFGFDAEKKGNQFDPKQYGKKILQGGGEGAMLASPVNGTFGQQFLVNAVPGVTEAIGEGGNIGDIGTKALARGLIGATATKVIGPAIGKGINKFGAGTVKTVEKSKELAKKGGESLLSSQFNVQRSAGKAYKLKDTIKAL